MLPIQQTIPFSDYSDLYDLIIPQDNLLRRINDLVDFSFIQKELMDQYCQDNGRMAESPVMMFLTDTVSAENGQYHRTRDISAFENDNYGESIADATV